MASYCRICLFKVEAGNSLNIFTTTSPTGELIVDMLKNLAPVQISEEDALPKDICAGCFDTLKTTYEFRNLIVTSDMQLRQGECDFKADIELMPASGNEETEDIKIAVEMPTIQPKKERKRCKCVQCTEVFTNRELLLSHIAKDHSGNLPYSCDVCNKGFLLKWQMNVHRSKVHIEGTEHIELIAASGTEETEDIKITVEMPKIVLRKERKRYKCVQCTEGFSSRELLLSHIAKDHSGNLPYPCDICNKGFLLKWQMSVHRKVHFEERLFKCNACEKSFRFHSSLIQHKKIHTGERPHKCDICGKRFTQSGGLSVHRRRHTGEKPFVCEFCSKCFTGMDSLCKHLKTHKKDPEKPCPVCGKMYSGNRSLTIHMKTHSGEKPYSCEACGKRFSARSSLRIHMRIHEGVKPYSCEICGKKFTQGNCVVRHMRIHSGETPYPCNFCEKRFSYSHHLLKHLKKDHPSEQQS